MIRVANAAGFWGDRIDAAQRLVEAVEVDFLTLEYLAELTMSILARQRRKRADAGWAGDFAEVVASITRSLAEQPQLHVVTNAGGVNPIACARAAAGVLATAGLGGMPIAVVTGDDLLGSLPTLQQQGCGFSHLETGRPLAEAPGEILAANAYLGARPIVEALAGGARIVITARGPTTCSHGDLLRATASGVGVGLGRGLDSEEQPTTPPAPTDASISRKRRRFTASNIAPFVGSGTPT